jgi:hypothetical protein
VLLVAAAGIAAVAIVVVAYTGTIGSCASPFSIWYAKPIAGHCPAAGPSVAFLFTQIREAAVGAALLGFIVLPAAYRGGRTLASSLQAAGPVLRRTSAATVAAGAGAALCCWAVTGSAHGIVPAGSIGQDGFLREAGYTIRLMPYWYDQTAAGPAAPVTLTDSLGSVPGFGSARFSVLSAPASASADQADEAKLLSLGARWTSIGGAPALRLRTTNLLGDSEDVWFVSHDGTERLATLVASSDVATLAESDTAAMMATWTWTSQTRFAGGGP